ncbi:PIR Superfamily Protein [Plasmodium malariae]|uniref:PIR Superfamily Protein n=1 Tax=Plasmodium malariae TaxID=5858 RepID=A0A1A8WK69_PLAMA|nr:PIR Superfamily Protein [Plasmodium malariae]
MEAVNYEEIFKDSKPYNIYKELEDEVKDVTDGQHCTEFDGITSTHKEKYVTLCKKVSKLLNYVFDKDKLKKSKEYCTHYKYWVYHEIWKLFKNGQQTDDIHVIDKFNILQSDLFVKHNKRDCSYGYILKDYEELKYKIEMKYLYDYFKNYNTIKSSKQCSNVGGKNYRAYLEAIKKLYDVEYNSCCSTGLTECPDYILTCDDKFDPNKLLSALASRAIKKLYDVEYNSCCSTGLTECPDYILTCDDKFDPNKLLSALASRGTESCDGLSSITANFDEEKLNSVVTDPEILNSIAYGTCFNLKNGRLTSDIKRHPHCSLLATSVTLTRSFSTAEYGGTIMTDSGSPPGSTNLESMSNQAEVDASRRGQPDAKGKRGDFGESGVKIEAVPPVKDEAGPIRWKFDERGTLQCPSKSKNKYEELLCEYMDVLVEGNFATKIDRTGKYKVQIGRTWNESDLKQYRIAVRKRRSANESNILNNIFVRISTGVTLFTPFGPRLHRHRKRQQRYRLDFTDLSTRKRPRRFLKRTYRHSDRRRFNVVNIEDELHSSKDLQNIN